jgi:hypothetical protein
MAQAAATFSLPARDMTPGASAISRQPRHLRRASPGPRKRQRWSDPACPPGAVEFRDRLVTNRIVASKGSAPKSRARAMIGNALRFHFQIVYRQP